MKKTILLLLLLPLLSVAQDNGDLVFVYDAPKEYNRVTQELYFNKGLEKYRQYINRKFAFPYNITVHFTDCQDNNSWYSNGKITICYNYIKSQYSGVRKNIISDRLAGYEKLEKEAVLGITTLLLGHELGHGFADFHQMTYTGKQESAVDEFSLMTFLDYNDEPKDVRSFFGVVAWYFSGVNEIERMGFRRYAAAHAPSLVRYYDLLNLYYDSGVGKEYRSLLIEGVSAQPWQLPRSRVDYSSGEYARKKEIWAGILSPFLKTSQRKFDPNLYAPTDTVINSSNSVNAYTPLNQVGIAIASEWWKVGKKPVVYDTKQENGQIRFDVSINEVGSIVTVFVKETSVSSQLTEAYRKAVGNMKLIPKVKNVPSTSNGTILFNIKSR